MQLNCDLIARHHSSSRALYFSRSRLPLPFQFWPIRISVWFYKKGHADTLLGVCETTVDRLMNACLGDDEGIEDISEKDLILTRLNNEGKEVGTIRVTKAELVEPSEPEPPTSSLFGDSLSGGVPRAVSRASSTGSTNGAPRSMVSLNGAPVLAYSLSESFAGSVASDLNESFASAPCEILLPPMMEETPRMTRPRFKQYVDSGCEINLCFAIDFTSSNGEKRSAWEWPTKNCCFSYPSHKLASWLTQVTRAFRVHCTIRLPIH